MATVESPLSTITHDQGDFVKTVSFMTKVMEHAGAAVACTLCALGHRLGLFKGLDTGGPATSVQLAQRTALKERYVREWLSVLAAAGYLEYDPQTARFLLPPEHAPILARDGPMFMGRVYQHLPGLLGPFERLIEVFQRGGGIRPHADGKSFRTGLETVSAGWYVHHLVRWLSAIDGLQAKLESGADVADIGCGSGLALIGMAHAFPKARFVGYESFGPFIPRATANAEAAGVADRVRFEQCDIVKGPFRRYDLITSFDVLYDIANPVAVLRAIRAALRPAGTYIMVEIKCSENLEEAGASIATVLDGTSAFVSTPTSMAGTAGMITTAGMPESRLREVYAHAGFRTVARLPLEHLLEQS
jgi:2-polyprenyl-3-methyl-5-hydroxy-6-metoxy-1,4-benzoquinol methylase